MGKILLGAGGLLAGLAASSCCVLPLTLAALGIGGTWLSTLNGVAAYEMYFRVAAIILLAAGFWLVYAPPKIAAPEATCPVAPSQKLSKTLLWTGAAVVAVVLLTRWLMPIGPMA